MGGFEVGDRVTVVGQLMHGLFGEVIDVEDGFYVVAVSFPTDEGEKVVTQDFVAEDLVRA